LLLVAARHARRCSSLLVTARRCSSLLVAARRCSSLIIAARRCSSLLVAAHRCSSLLVAAHRCSSLLVYYFFVYLQHLHFRQAAFDGLAARSNWNPTEWT
jgi:hypothetical protein